MKAYRAIYVALILGVSSSVYATEVDNVSRILSVGKLGANVCRIKLQAANFAAACPTAIYQEADFTCDSSEGKDLLAIALTAYAADRTARVTSNACSVHGSSVANVIGIMLE
jgi:hypothetical protein